jgi:hypothetical protein
VSCQYFPCSSVPTLPPCARPAFGWGSNPPSCSCSAGASSRGVLPGAGALAGCRTPIQPVCSISARATRQIEIETIALPRSPCAESLKPPPVADEVTGDGAWACFRRPRNRRPQVRSFGCFHRISNHKSPRLTHDRVRFHHLPAQRRKLPDMGVFEHQGGVSPRYVRCLASYAVPGDHICLCLPDKKFARGFIPARLHTFDRDGCHVSGPYFPRTKFLAYSRGPISSDKVILLLQVHRRPEVLYVCVGGGLLFERADPEHGHDKGAGLQGRRSNPRENLAGLSYVVRDAEFGIARFHDCGSRASCLVHLKQ